MVPTRTEDVYSKTYILLGHLEHRFKKKPFIDNVLKAGAGGGGRQKRGVGEWRIAVIESTIKKPF